jgi:oxalate---CoA ligase
MRISVPKDHLSPSRLIPQTLAEAIAQHAVRDPNRPAIVGTQFAPFSFRELDLWIKQIGEQLRTAGIGPHSRVGIMLPPGPEGAVLGVAVASHAISVPLNSNRPEPEIEEELARDRLDALVLPNWVDSSALAIAQRSAFGLLEASRAVGSLSSVALRQVRETPVPTSASGLTVKQRALIKHIAAGFAPHPKLDSIALIFTTSGTTGTAKLVPVTHENLLVTADKMRQWFNLSSDDRTAFVLPGYYGAAIKISLLAPLLLGGSVGLPPARHVQDLVEWIPDLCPTWLWGNPTFFQAVLDRLRSRAGIKLTHSLRFVVAGTTYLPPTLRAELEKTLGVPVLQSYGMSEAGILAADPAPPYKRKPGTVGLISRDELTIVGPKGDPLPDGEVGEIVVHGPTVSPDIGTDAEAEAQHSNDRWLFTGDVGSIDSERYLTVVGRTKELINRGGEKISPYEVERALLLHPSVKEAAAFSVPHPRLGENVAAAVVLKPETNPSTQDIKTFLADYLAPFKIPQHVFVVPQLLKGASGKVSRSELSQATAHRIRDVAPPGTPLEVLIRDIWQTLLHRDDVGIDDDFFELGGDSLLAVQMVLEVEATARRKIPSSALRAIYTVRQLAATILRTDSTSEELVSCAKQGVGAPFFFCHGEFPRGLWALRLVDRLRCDRPVFLADPDPKLSIEEMAKCYLPHLLAAQPTGAFCLGGYCNGGLLAWELAHQLESLGREIEFVVVIETRSFNARLPFRMIARLTRLIAAVAPGKISEKFKLDAMRAIWGRMKRPVYYGPYFRAMSNYLPPKLQCDVVAILCDESREMKEMNTIPWRNLARKVHRRYEYSTIPWSHLARKVHNRYVAGTHVSAPTTYAGELALLLDDILSAGPTFDRLGS